MPDGLQRDEVVFEAVLKAGDSAAQLAVIERECGSDLALRKRVEERLRNHQDRSSPTLCIQSIVSPAAASGGTATFVTETAGGSNSAEPRFKAGDRLGKYQITAFLSRGGMGEVYRGFDPMIERDVALKVLPAELANQPIPLQRFLVEARAVGKLQHAHTVSLYEIGQDGQTMFMAMEFVPGGSLQDLVSKAGKLPWQRATRLMHELCLGLADAHAVGLVHRDIKPANVLLTRDDRVKITDFGLAKVHDALGQSAMNLTSSGQVVGTPYYMSPEQFNGDPLDRRTDLYSAGATYYCLLTGQRPYIEAVKMVHLMYAHNSKPIPDPRSSAVEVPAGCAAIVAKAMAKKPDDRYATAAEMAEALARLLEVPQKAKEEPVFWLVEPSRLQARVLQAGLAELGVRTVKVFANLTEILAAVGQSLPHVILSSMHLDDGTGEELAEKIHALPGGKNVAVYLISSDPVGGSTTGSRPGRPLVLTKPVTRDALTMVVERARNSRS